MIAVMVLGNISVVTSSTAFFPGVYDTDRFFNSKIGFKPLVTTFTLSIYELQF